MNIRVLEGIEVLPGVNEALGPDVVRPPSPVRNRNLKWCANLKRIFTDAVAELGGPFNERATPAAILEVMRVRRLEVFHIEPRLEAYRLQMGTEENYVAIQRRSQLASVKRLPNGAFKVRLPRLRPGNPQGLPVPRRYGPNEANGLIWNNTFLPVSELRTLFDANKNLITERVREFHRQYFLELEDAEGSTVTSETVDPNELDADAESSLPLDDLRLTLGFNAPAGEQVKQEEGEKEMKEGEKEMKEGEKEMKEGEKEMKEGEKEKVNLSLSLAPAKDPSPDLSKFK